MNSTEIAIIIGFIYSVSPNGKIRWHMNNLEGVISMYTTPVIDEKGIIYVGTDTGTLYAIGGEVENQGNGNV